MKMYSSDLDDTLGNELIQFGGLVAGNSHTRPRAQSFTNGDDVSDALHLSDVDD